MPPPTTPIDFGRTVFFFGKVPELGNTNEKVLPGDIVNSVLQKASPGLDPRLIMVRDAWKVTWDRIVYDNFMLLDIIKNRQYVSDAPRNPDGSIRKSFDCDKYSAVMFGLAAQVLGNSTFGVFDHDRTKLGDAHSINFFIDSDLRLWVVEPQTGEIMDYELYSFRVGAVARCWIL